MKVLLLILLCLTLSLTGRAEVEELMGIFPDMVAIQWHGNSGAGCPDVIIGNTNGNYTQAPGGPVETLAVWVEALDGGTVRACSPRPTTCNLCGTGNMQGRFTNGSGNPCTRSASSPYERFIHVEQSLRFRRSYQARVDALYFTFPVE